jgi:type VI secretion system protein ImpH
VRLIEQWLARHGDPAAGARANFLRFANSTSLRFPASELEAILPEPREQALDGAALTASLASGALRYVQLVPAFAGLTGQAGALPVHYTERIVAHGASTKDAGARAFLDIFSSRSHELFYEGWRKYRLEQQGGDSFLPLLLALAGVGNAALRERQRGVLDQSLGHFAAAVRQRPASSVQIGRVLSAYFDAPVRLEQFVGHWYGVPLAQQSRLGLQHCVLGAGAMAGERVWQRDLRMRLVVGPLEHEPFLSFLPGGTRARALREWLAMFSGVTLEYEVQLVLLGRDVRGVTLGAAIGARLGWDSFLAPHADGADRSDVCYELMTL